MKQVLFSLTLVISMFLGTLNASNHGNHDMKNYKCDMKCDHHKEMKKDHKCDMKCDHSKKMNKGHCDLDKKAKKCDCKSGGNCSCDGKCSCKVENKATSCDCKKGGECTCKGNCKCEIKKL